MPSHFPDCRPQYLQSWKDISKENNAKFNLINNSKENDIKEQEKVLNSNILILTGGNTFQFLHNLRKSGLDKTIKEFVKKDEFIIAAFSAGAIVLTPTIGVAGLEPDYDENKVGIKDLTGLNIIDFEIYPHYSEIYEQSLEKYRGMMGNVVREIRDGDNIVIDL